MDQNLKQKIHEAMNCSFVGSYIFTKEELTIIYDDVSKRLLSIIDEWGETLSPIYYDEIFIALVNLAKEWSPEEDAFFEYVYRKLLGAEISNGKIYNQIVELIKHLNRQNKIFLFKSFKKKYYTSICSHAFAPLSSIYAFLDICWEIYCEDLNQQYVINDPSFEVVANNLKNKFSEISNDDEDFQIGSRSYALRAGIKGLALDEKDKLIHLFDVAIRTIHSLFNNEIITYDDYFKIIVKNWWTSKELEFGISKTKRVSNREIIVRDYSQIKPKYIMTDDTIKLIIPSFRINENFDNNLYIEIKVDNSVVSCVPMQLRGSGFLMATREKEIDISEIESLNVQIEITHCNHIIYSSRQELCRDFLLFNANGKEIAVTECIPGLYFLYINKFNNLIQYPKDLERISIINTFSINALDGDILQTKNKEIFFLNEKSNKEVSFSVNKLGNIIYREKDEDYCVIDGELFVEVLNNSTANNFGVKYEESVFKLIDFDFTTINDRKRYCISSLLMPGDTQHIALFKFSDNTVIANINLIKFNNIHIEFNKEIYYGNPQKEFVEFKTDNYYVKQDFIVGDEEVYIPIKEGHIIVSPPLFKWKLDNELWNTTTSQKPLWYKDITNSSILYIDAPKDKNIEICINNNYIEKQHGKLCFKLGEEVYRQKEISNITEHVIFARIDGKVFHQLFRIYTKEQFLTLPYSVDSLSRKLIWNPNFYIGDQESKFVVTLERKNSIAKQISLDLKGEIIDLNEIEEDYYNLSIKLLKRSLIEKNEILLKNKLITLGNEKNLKFKNKIIKIETAFLYESLRFNKIQDKTNYELIKEVKQIRPVYIESVIYLGNRNGYDYYSGVLFVKNKDGEKIYLNHMKKDDGSYVKINPVRMEYKGETTCYLGYGLDEDDDEYFEYDDDFTINRDKITIGKITNGEKNLLVDYFGYEVENV